MNFDISAIEASTKNTFDVIVGHNDESRADPVGFKVVGPGSDEYIAAERAIQLMNIKDAAKRKDALDLATDEGAGAVVDGSDARRLAVLERCVTGWFGFKDGKKAAEFNVENLKRVLKARPLWGRRLLAAIEDEANFTVG